MVGLLSQTFSCALDKARFFKDIGYEPHAGQQLVHDSRASRRVVACGVRWGKSVCAAMEGLAAAMEPAKRSCGWVVAPTYDLADKVFRELLFVASEKLQHRIVKVQEGAKKLVLRNAGGGLSEIRAKSADNPVSLLGEGLDWLIVDEAARLRPDIWEGYLSQRLLDKRGWALLISTPKGKGCFYDLFRAGQGRDSAFASWNMPSSSNPYLDGDLLEAERKRLPARVFAQEYGAEFIEGSGAVFRHVRDCATATWQEPEPGMRYFAGLDLAKTNDYTVLCIMNTEYEVVYVDRFHRLDWALQVTRIKAAAERYHMAEILCDSTGVGEPVFESMRTEGMNVTPYQFTARSKSDLINHLSLLLEQKRLTLPKPDLWPEGIDELEAFEYSVTDSGHVKTGSPSGYHDDCVIGLALSAWLTGQRGVPHEIIWF